MKRIAVAVSMMVLVLGVAVLAKTQTGTAEQELIKLEKDWLDALVKSDLAFIDQILVDDWTATDQDGTFYSKPQYLAYLKSGEEVTSSAVADEMKVRVYGDAAVVTGRNTFKGTLKGKDMSGQDRWTDTFVKKAGRWQCVASHWSRMPQK
jgi:ketosteroid isomerase-like protein